VLACLVKQFFADLLPTSVYLTTTLLLSAARHEAAHETDHLALWWPTPTCTLLAAPLPLCLQLKRADVPLELEEIGLPMNTFGPKNPFIGKVVSVERIVGPKATGETCHIIIQVGHQHLPRTQSVVGWVASTWGLSVVCRDMKTRKERVVCGWPTRRSSLPKLMGVWSEVGRELVPWSHPPCATTPPCTADRQEDPIR
jgi:hypothetical protein